MEEESTCYLPIHGRCRLNCAEAFGALHDVWDALNRAGITGSDSAADLVDQLAVDLSLARATIAELQVR
ncbi:hypothetical protein [Salinispora vitiensis]|uniref:hypothetical protein n=1 Tax=Salinispora vitiensis TaxID=999544 RepID=UPI0003756C80|nr:hypothetical protein [Salinispora vitiensis]